MPDSFVWTGLIGRTGAFLRDLECKTHLRWIVLSRRSCVKRTKCVNAEVLAQLRANYVPAAQLPRPGNRRPALLNGRVSQLAVHAGISEKGPTGFPTKQGEGAVSVVATGQLL